MPYNIINFPIIRIELDALEREFTRRIAKGRVDHCIEVDAGYESTYDDDDDGSDYELRLQKEYQSFGGEVAYGKLFGLKADDNVKHFFPEDFIHKTRQRVDVKTTRYLLGCLQAKARKHWKDIPDYFALMVGDFPAYWFKGYMRGRELLTPARMDGSSRQKSPVYKAEQWELHQDFY
jgi:hypothetical protein